MASLLSFGDRGEGVTMGPTGAVVHRVLREVWAVGARAKKKSAKKKSAVIVPGTKTPAKGKNDGKPVRDGQDFIKKEVLGQLRGITKGMISKAAAGGTGPLKLLWELGKLHENPTSRRRKAEPSLAKILMKGIREQAALQKKAAAAEHEAEAGKQK